MAVVGPRATLALRSPQSLLTLLCWSCVANGSLSCSSLTHEHHFSCVSTKASLIGTSKRPWPVTCWGEAGLARKPVCSEICRNMQELLHIWVTNQVETTQHLALPGLMSLGFFTQGAIIELHRGCHCYCNLSHCFSPSLSFPLTESVSSCLAGGSVW